MNSKVRHPGRAEGVNVLNTARNMARTRVVFFFLLALVFTLFRSPILAPSGFHQLYTYIRSKTCVITFITWRRTRVRSKWLAGWSVRRRVVIHWRKAGKRTKESSCEDNVAKGNDCTVNVGMGRSPRDRGWMLVRKLILHEIQQQTSVSEASEGKIGNAIAARCVCLISSRLYIVDDPWLCFSMELNDFSGMNWKRKKCHFLSSASYSKLYH